MRKSIIYKNNYFADNSDAQIINRLTTDVNAVDGIADRGVVFILSYFLLIVGGGIGLLIEKEFQDRIIIYITHN